MLDLIYKDGQFVRKWSLVDGYPQCLEDAVDSISDAAVTALQRGVAIGNALDLVTAYEAAAANPNADDSASIIANAADVTKAFALWRTPKPAATIIDPNALPDDENPPMVDNSAAVSAWEAARDKVVAAIEVAAQAPLLSDPRPVPDVIPLWKAKAILAELGLLDQATAIVTAASPAVLQYWRNASEIHRDAPTLDALAGGLNLSPGQLDDMFRKANAIVL